MSQTQLQRIWFCPGCGVEEVEENRGISKKKFERYTDYGRFRANRGCRHDGKLFSSGRCKVCGAKLTDPISVNRGIGPCCWEKVQEQAKLQEAVA